MSALLRAHEQKIFHDTLPYRHFFEKIFRNFFSRFHAAKLNRSKKYRLEVISKCKDCLFR